MRITEQERSNLIAIGKQLRGNRKLCNMTQAQVGEKLGVSGQQVCKYEYGIDQVSILLAIRYSEIFMKSLSELFNLDGTI